MMKRVKRADKWILQVCCIHLCLCVCLCRWDSNNDVWEKQTFSRLMDVLQESRFAGPEHCPSPPNTSENGTQFIILRNYTPTQIHFWKYSFRTIFQKRSLTCLPGYLSTNQNGSVHCSMFLEPFASSFICAAALNGENEFTLCEP